MITIQLTHWPVLVFSIPRSSLVANYPSSNTSTNSNQSQASSCHNFRYLSPSSFPKSTDASFIRNYSNIII